MGKIGIQQSDEQGSFVFELIALFIVLALFMSATTSFSSAHKIWKQQRLNRSITHANYFCLRPKLTDCTKVKSGHLKAVYLCQSKTIHQCNYLTEGVE